jgi:hypothetical protein
MINCKQMHEMKHTSKSWSYLGQVLKSIYSGHNHIPVCFDLQIMTIKCKHIGKVRTDDINS